MTTSNDTDESVDAEFIDKTLTEYYRTFRDHHDFISNGMQKVIESNSDIRNVRIYTVKMTEEEYTKKQKEVLERIADLELQEKKLREVQEGVGSSLLLNSDDFTSFISKQIEEVKRRKKHIVDMDGVFLNKYGVHLKKYDAGITRLNYEREKLERKWDMLFVDCLDMFMNTENPRKIFSYDENGVYKEHDVGSPIASLRQSYVYLVLAKNKEDAEKVVRGILDDTPGWDEGPPSFFTF